MAVLASRMEDGSLDAAPVWSDVRTVPDVVRADWCIGGFPCQDISTAGKKAGIGGERSGLWFAMLDAAVRAGCRYLFVENVGRLVLDGLDAVCGSLADRGFDAEWLCLRAADVGAPHGRDRWFGLAWRREELGHAAGDRREARPMLRRVDGEDYEAGEVLAGVGARRTGVADSIGGRSRDERRERVEARGELGAGGEAMADADLSRREGRGVRDAGRGDERAPGAGGSKVADPERDGLHRLEEQHSGSHARFDDEHRGHADRRGIDLPLFPPGPGRWQEGRDERGVFLVPLDRDAARWVEVLEARPDLAPATESDVRRVADGMAARVDRLRGCGNGVVVVQGAAALVELLRRAS